MKKVLIFFAVIVIIIAIVAFRYVSYHVEYKVIQDENAEYEQYKDKELTGLDIATIINKTIDKNTKNEVAKDEKGLFIQNDTNSIDVEIYIVDNEETYEFKMETIYKGGTEQFVQHYRDIKFKCSKIEYHKNTGRIKYILFEQLPIS